MVETDAEVGPLVEQLGVDGGRVPRRRTRRTRGSLLISLRSTGLRARGWGVVTRSGRIGAGLLRCRRYQVARSTPTAANAACRAHDRG